VGEVAVKLEQMAGRGSGVGPVDPTRASSAQQAATDRLDLLYRMFELFGEKSKRDAGYSTLTRGSLETIFDRLIDKYGLSGVPVCNSGGQHRSSRGCPCIFIRMVTNREGQVAVARHGWWALRAEMLLVLHIDNAAQKLAAPGNTWKAWL